MDVIGSREISILPSGVGMHPVCSLLLCAKLPRGNEGRSGGWQKLPLSLPPSLARSFAKRPLSLAASYTVEQR